MVKAVETDLKSILEGEKQYTIPLYQRPYQWDKAQWTALWNDIIELQEDREEQLRDSHFIGSLVLVPAEVEMAIGVRRFLVVDGQQRLTTLSLLLAAVSDHFSSEGNDAASRRVRDQFLVNLYQEGEGHLKLLPTQADRDQFKEVIATHREKIPAGRIGDAYRFFKLKVKKFSESKGEGSVAKLEQTIVNGLSLVQISTHGTDNVHRIFQSLNNTGLKLTQGDLIRNYIFMKLPNRSEAVYEKYWRPMQELLENDQLEGLFWLDLTLQRPDARAKDTFVLQQQRINELHSEDEIEKDMARISKLAELYYLILNPSQEKDPNVRFRLTRLSDWGSRTPHSLVLALLDRRKKGLATNEELARALHVIESYVIRRFLIGQKTQGTNQAFMKVLNQLLGEEPVDVEINRALSKGRSHFHSDEAVREAVKQAPYYLQGKQAHQKIFLQWLEQEFGSKEPVDTSKLSIEHIMPQTLNAVWRDRISKSCPPDVIDEVHSATVHTLGNLSLTGYNAELSNSDFSVKKAEFAKSGLRLNLLTTQFDDWNPELISKRAELLADQIIESWPGPSNEANQTNKSPIWETMEEIIGLIPDGHWTSYGDLAAAIGTNAQSVGNRLSNYQPMNAYRVLRSDGTVADGFQSTLFSASDTTPRSMLEAEGLQFTANGQADPAYRLSPADLVELISFDEPELD